MSIICLICKNTLLNNAPGSPLGSLNSLLENQVIATGCGHLYHAECLQCWFRTQKKKLQNQGVTENLPNYCPTCQFEVHDEQIRRVHLLEDHREALEKAKFLERMENLEIYCHQLEINVQQLQRENDILLNKALSPIKSPFGNDECNAIVKNDRVIWLKKDSSPLSGIVVSIFKKEGTLWVKLKLDKKIRTNQRSGLLGSFRFDKKQEWTVPFEDIVLEKDFKKNNVIDEDNATAEPTTPTLFVPLQKVPSFRSSTLSLPGEYFGQNYSAMRVGKVQSLQPNLSYEFVNNYGSSIELSSRVNSNSGSIYNENKTVHTNGSLPSVTGEIENATTIENNDNEKEADDQREYVVMSPKPSNSQNNLSNKVNSEGRTSPQDGKAKHVTFADDLLKKILPSMTKSSKGNHFRDHDYKNVMEMPVPENARKLENNKDDSVQEIKITVTENGSGGHKNETPKPDSSSLQIQPVEAPPSIQLSAPSTSSTPRSSLLSLSGEMQMDAFTNSFDQSSPLNDKNFNGSCFDIFFTALFYGCDVFDRAILLRSDFDDTIQLAVHQILSNGFVNPIRNSEVQQYSVGYANHLFKIIANLCSSHLDLEELMTILFEYVFKIPPFIGYSYDMCDYIHQFFIDFTDKAKKPTVQQLFEQSLALQDNLKLRREPSPALFLQMPNSEEGIIHYEAVLPSLTLNIEHCLENVDEVAKTEALTCYCNKVATLECAECAKNHGKSPILFCDDCSVLLEAIHDQMYHKLELSPIKVINLPSINLELTAVICLKSDKYSVFLRNTNSNNGQWTFIEDFENGKPKIEKLSKMEEWVESVERDPSSLHLAELNKFQHKLLTECRMLMYLPAHNSFA